MLGVFRNDVYVLKKQLIISAVTAVIVLAFGLLSCGSLRYGNLAKLPEENFDATYSIMTMIFGPISAALIGFANPFAISVFTNRQSGWYSFLYATPITASRIAFVNLLERAGYILISTLFGFISTFSCYGLAGREITSTDIFILLVAVLLTGLLTFLPTSYLLKTANAEVMLRIVLIYAASVVTFIGATLSLAEFEKAVNGFVDNLPLICFALLAIDIVVFLISWRISAKILEKRKL